MENKSVFLIIFSLKNFVKTHCSIVLKNSGKQQIQFEYFENKSTMDKKTGLSDETVDQFREFMKMIEGFYHALSEIETEYRPSPEAEIIGDWFPQEITNEGKVVFKAMRKSN